MSFYVDYIISKNGYDLLCSSVAISTLENAYNNWLKIKECTAIEFLPIEDKKRLWNLSKRYEGEKRLVATKAAYAIELIIKLLK